MVRIETSVFTVDTSTTHPDCSTMSTDRCLNASRQPEPSPAGPRPSDTPHPSDHPLIQMTQTSLVLTTNFMAKV